MIENLNINFISNKFGNLKLKIHGKVHIFVITESKTDTIFSLNQFAIPGNSKPYRFDRNRNRGGVREDILSREIKICNTQKLLKAFCQN